MKIKLKNFDSEIEWFVCGEHLFLDKSMSYLAQLIASSPKIVTNLANVVQNMPIDEQIQVPLLKKLIKKSNNRYEQLYIADANGNYFNADAQKDNILDRHYFNLVMQGQTVISEPIINKSTRKLVVAVATPIRQNKKVCGLFGATIELNLLDKGKKTGLWKKHLKKSQKFNNQNHTGQVEGSHFYKTA